jgi:hypothetical protein
MNDTATATVRQKQIEARRQRVATLMPKTPRIRVMPRDDEVRRFIAHAPSGLRFPAHGSVEWPHDTFTRRRIADGTVIAVEPEPPQHRRGTRQADE